MELFGVDIQSELASALAGQLRAGELVRQEPGARDPLNPSAGRAMTPVTYTFEGFTDRRTKRVGETRTETEVTVLSIVGGSVRLNGVVQPDFRPRQGDEVAIDGTEYEVVLLRAVDPAAALYECEVST